MSLSNHAEDMLLTWAFTAASAPTRPTEWFVALHTADPGEACTNSEMIVGTDADYARKSVTFSAPSSGSSASAGSVSHTPAVAAGSYTVTHVSVWDAVTAGNALIYGALVIPRTISNANPFTISAGDLVAALD